MRIRTHVIVAGFVLAVVTTTAFAQTGGPPTALYRLQEGSTYEEGCYGQCMCPVIQAPLEGTFGLEFLPASGPVDMYRVDEVDFVVPALNKTISGSGFYTLAGEFNQLQLDLQINGEPAQHFHSGGLVPAGAEFPDIDIVISVNQMMTCFDHVLHIVASPDATPYPTLLVASSELAWSVVSGAEGYDVVRGNLGHLRGSAGDFTPSTDQCLESAYPDTSMTYDVTPAAGEALWFLVRDDGGSYDSGGDSQNGSRDIEIDSSPLACP